MARIQKEIILPHGELKKLYKEVGCAEVTARLALKGMTDTPTARLIRKRAMENHYGVERKA